MSDKRRSLRRLIVCKNYYDDGCLRSGIELTGDTITYFCDITDSPIFFSIGSLRHNRLLPMALSVLDHRTTGGIDTT